MTKAEAKRKLAEASGKLTKVWSAQYTQGNLLSRAQMKKLNDAMDKILTIFEGLNK
tara:strand:- start:29 stop:196 length:168 start_codon:yes stop_codon:yes gene_type:complete